MEPAERYRQVASLHAAGINQGFLATLGIPFLSLMYQSIDEAPGSVLIVDEVSGIVRGFVSGGVGMGPIYRRMLRHPFRLAAALLPTLVRPARLRRIIDILRYGKQAEGISQLPDAELLSIAVAPESRGSGVAESLYERLEQHFSALGVNVFKITVGDSLATAPSLLQPDGGDAGRKGGSACGRGFDGLSATTLTPGSPGR